MEIDCNHVVGCFLEFDWRDGNQERFRVVYVAWKHSSFRLMRSDGVEVRFYLHGKMTTMTLEVEYPSEKGAGPDRVSELAQWAFYLANLKSIALQSVDLRHRMTDRGKENGFID